MPAFRYAQFCPLARAAEILGHRWTLLIARELLLGPKRFSDLRRPLAGVSPSVLADRLATLEASGIVTQRHLPPPTPATLYELTDTGRALTPAIVELARWGARFLGVPRPGDHVEADWVRLGLMVFARPTPTPARSYAIHVEAPGGGATDFRVEGGLGGTAISQSAEPADVALSADSPLAIMGLAAGALDPGDAVRTGQIRVDGAVESLDEFKLLFDMEREPTGPPAASSTTPNPRGT